MMEIRILDEVEASPVLVVDLEVVLDVVVVVDVVVGVGNFAVGVGVSSTFCFNVLSVYDSRSSVRVISAI